MDPSHPINTWSPLGDRFYRSVQLFENTFLEEYDLERCIVAAAPFGGAIAIYQRPVSLLPGLRSSIEIYNGAGILLREITWDKSGIVAIGWSVSEQLLIVSEGGLVRCYQELLGDYNDFGILSEGKSETVLSCCFYSVGFVALLSNRTFVHVTDYSDSRIMALSAIPPGEIHTWALIALSNHVEVLVAVDDGVLLVDDSSVVQRNIQGGPFRQIAVSPNGDLVALYTSDGKVIQSQSDLMGAWYKESKISSDTPPLDMVWCGNYAPMLVWDREIIIVGPTDSHITYDFFSFVTVAPDCDGVRIFTDEGLSFVQRVPSECEEIFRIGSQKPGSILLTSFEQLSGKSHKSHNWLQSIQDNLETAVEDCIGAAGHEFNARWQTQLLHAASFGKSALDFYDSDEFVRMFTILRVLNAVRDQSVGMSLTFDQLTALGQDRLVFRLASRHLYPLAFEVAEYLKLPVDKIYSHWAIQKVMISIESDEHVFQVLKDRLRGQLNIPFAEIADAAFSQGKTHLATDLLSLEPRSGKQVQLLLDMQQDSLALRRALGCHNTDLIYHVLMTMHKRTTRPDFLGIIANHNIPLALVERWAESNDMDLLRALYHVQDRRDYEAGMSYQQAIWADAPDIRKIKLDEALSKLKTNKPEKPPRYDFHRIAILESQKLLKAQTDLEKEYNPILRNVPHDDNHAAVRIKFIGLSLNDTILELVKMGAFGNAGSVKSDFKVSEESYWRLQLRGLVATRNWKELEKFAGMKKASPISWLSFFQEISLAGNLPLAGKFVKKCREEVPAPGLVSMYVRCAMPVEAAEEAVRLNSRDLVTEVQRACTIEPRDAQRIKQIMADAGWK